jgi:predicted nucleic acid-binding protein
MTLQLADSFRLTAYDAVYLELARRRSLPLATLDQDLRRAGTTLGISLLGQTPVSDPSNAVPPGRRKAA